MTSIEEQLEHIRAAIFSMANSLGAAMPHTPQVMKAMRQLEEDSAKQAQQPRL